MHWYRLRHDGLDSSSAEKDLKYPDEKDITVDFWMNMRQKQALIANGRNCVMYFIEDHSQQTGENYYPALLGFDEASSAYWVQFSLTHFKRYEEGECSKT